MRMTAKEKLVRNIARMSEIFNVDPLRATIGTCGRCTAGLYIQANKRYRKTFDSDGRWIGNELDPEPQIVIDRGLSFRKSLETQMHEFAHHLDHLNCLGSHEPPQHLPEVRARVLGEQFRHRNMYDWNETEVSILKPWW